MPKETNFPITFSQFQEIMNGLGYGLSHHNPETKIIHWRKERTKKGLEKAPDCVTTLRPDFNAIGFDEPVYSRDYVVDLFMNLAGGNLDDGVTFPAFRN